MKPSKRWIPPTDEQMRQIFGPKWNPKVPETPEPDMYSIEGSGKSLTRGASFTAINPFTPDEVWVEGGVDRAVAVNPCKGFVITGVDFKRRTITLEPA